MFKIQGKLHASKIGIINFMHKIQKPKAYPSFI